MNPQSVAIVLVIALAAVATFAAGVIFGATIYRAGERKQSAVPRLFPRRTRVVDANNDPTVPGELKPPRKFPEVRT